MGEQFARAQAPGAAAREGGEQHPDAEHIGGGQESEQRDAGVSHPAGAQLGERHCEQQDHEQQGRRGEQQPHPPGEVDDLPALRLVDPG